MPWRNSLSEKSPSGAPKRDQLVVTGVPAGARLTVFPSDLVSEAGWQPVAGRLSEHDGELVFTPRFPLVQGLQYALMVDGVPAGSIEVPAEARVASTRVVSISAGAFAGGRADRPTQPAPHLCDVLGPDERGLGEPRGTGSRRRYR